MEKIFCRHDKLKHNHKIILSLQAEKEEKGEKDASQKDSVSKEADSSEQTKDSSDPTTDKKEEKEEEKESKEEGEGKEEVKEEGEGKKFSLPKIKTPKVIKDIRSKSKERKKVRVIHKLF